MATYRLKSKLFGPAPGPKPKPTPKPKPKPINNPKNNQRNQLVTSNSTTTMSGGQGGSVNINLITPHQQTQTSPANNPAAQAQQTQNAAQEAGQNTGRFGAGFVTGAGLGVAGTVGYGIYKNKKDEERSSEDNSQSLQPYYGG